jgi:alpha-mannosidase
MGLSIQAVAVVAHPDHILLDVVLAEEAEPNLEALANGLLTLEDHLTENKQTSFRLLARFATKLKISFIAKNVPGHGYRTFGLRPTLEEPRSTEKDNGNSIENDLFQVEVGLDGSLSLTDRRTGNNYTGLLRFRDQADRGDSYTFCPVDGDQPIETITDHPRLSRSIHPDVKTITIDLDLQLPAELAQDRRTRSSTLVEVPIKVNVHLREGVPRVDLDIEVENRAQDHRLQVLFPLPFGASEAAYDGHFEIAHRKTVRTKGDPDWAEQPTPEVPFRNFVAILRNQGGFMIAARGLREASVSPTGVVAITLLRCFGWLSRNDLATRKGGAGPHLATPGGQVPGKHTFHLSLIPFQGDLLQARTHAEAFQTHLRAASTTIHSADLPPLASLLTIEPQAFAVSSIKPAKDGSGMIVRGVNLDDKSLLVKLESPFALQSATLTRMDETPIEPLVMINNHSIQFDVQSQKIVTLHLEISHA